MELYFDKNGLISNVVNPTFNSTSDKAERITAIAAFDTSDFITNITFKRADSLILGPFIMNRTEEGYDYLDIYQPITMISGPLEMTIRYEVIVSGVVLQSKVVAKAVAFVNPAVEKGNDILAEIYERIKEGIYFKDGENGKSAYEIAVEHGFVGTVDEWLNAIYGDCIYDGPGIPGNHQNTWLDDEETSTEEIIELLTNSDDSDANTLIADEEESNVLVAEDNGKDEYNIIVAGEDKINTLIAED